jgi:hypothetical protein
MCRLFWNLGSSPSWNPQGLARPIMGLLYLYFYFIGLSNSPVKCQRTLLNYKTQSKNQKRLINYFVYINLLPVPVAARSKAWVYGCSLAGSVGSNPTRVMDVSLFWVLCVVRSLCDKLITRPEESYRLWCVVMCDLKTSRMSRSWPPLGRSATAKKKLNI